MVNVAHDGDHRGPRNRFGASSLFTGSSFGNLLGSLLFEADHVGVGAEEASHFAGELSIECLIDGRENTAGQ